MRLYILLRDLFDLPGISGRHEWYANGISRTEAWRQLTNRQTIRSGQDKQRQSDVSAGRNTPASIPATAALTRSRVLSTWWSANEKV